MYFVVFKVYLLSFVTIVSDVMAKIADTNGVARQVGTLTGMQVSAARLAQKWSQLSKHKGLIIIVLRNYALCVSHTLQQ